MLQVASTGGVTQTPCPKENAQSSTARVTILMMMDCKHLDIHTLNRPIQNLETKKIKPQQLSVTGVLRGWR